VRLQGVQNALARSSLAHRRDQVGLLLRILVEDQRLLGVEMGEDRRGWDVSGVGDLLDRVLLSVSDGAASLRRTARLPSYLRQTRQARRL